MFNKVLKMRQALGLLCLACASWAGAQPTPPATAPAIASATTSARVPLESFFVPSNMQDAQLSPSGRWMAALTSVAGRRVGFQMIDLEGKEANYFIEASGKDDVSWFKWVSEDWLVFKVADPNDRGFSNKSPGLLVVRRDGSSSRMLIGREFEIEDVFLRQRYLKPDHYYIGLGEPGSNEVIVGQSSYTVSYEFSHNTPKALNVVTGALRTLADGGPRADSWLIDAKGRPRVATRSFEGTSTVWWADAAGNWREIDKSPAMSPLFSPFYVDGDDNLVVGVSNKDSDLELRRFDFSAGRPGAQTLVRTQGFSGGVGPVTLRGSGEVVGLNLSVDSTTQVWFAPAMKAIQAKVNAKFPGHVNLLQCQPCDNPRGVLVYSYSDTDPGSFVLYRPQEDTWQLVGQARPDIDPRRMAGLDLYRTQARDGKDLPVWVTQPQQPQQPPGAAAKPAPAVVLVHGGPWVRGTRWRWNAEAQFLASRGYVVIEPEFRGSMGYGYAHHRAGWKQWGQAMQDDVTDALRFAVAKGWVDASRVCIIGASYGGYASLMGLVKDPDQYRCGVATAAVVDPRFMFDFHWNDIDEDGRKFTLPLLLGDRQKDAAMLAAASPLEHVDRIKAPVLLVHGAVDRRVPIENGERMLAALRKGGKSVDWVQYPDEGHSFKYLKNRLDYYRRVEDFLAKHLQ